MKRYVPLTFKVNILILITLILGIGIITFYLASRLFSTIEDTNKNSLLIQSRQIYASIESLMLPGQAELASGLFKRLALIDSNFETHIYRVDGTEAFVDNNTIQNVNGRLQEMRFDERQMPPTPTQTIIDANFQKATTIPATDVFFEIEEGGETYYRIFKPLLNLPKCVVCHGPDHTIRGVLEIRSNISDTVNLQRGAIISSSVFFLVMVVLSALILTGFMYGAVLKPVRSIADVCLGVTKGELEKRISLNSKDELGELGKTVNTMIEGLIERFKLSKYVSSSTIQSIQTSEAERKTVKTLLFSDVRGFTSFSETKSPEDVVRTLNQILNVQTELIHEYHGDVDKYVGDEIFALFEGPDAVLRACETALRIQERMTANFEAFSSLDVGIGIHIGEVIQGMIGSERRADFTVIGDSVNLAARLCSSAKAQEILLSDAAFAALKGTQGASQRLQRLKLSGPYLLKVKGKLNEQSVYKLVGVRS